jgi:hypothetical protein
MYKRSLLNRVGGVAKAMWEDLATTLRFSSLSEPTYIAKPIVEYRVHDRNVHLGIVGARRHVHAHAEAIRLLESWSDLPAAQRPVVAAHSEAWKALEQLADEGRARLAGVPQRELSAVVRRQASDLLRDLDIGTLRRFELALLAHGCYDGARALGEGRDALWLRAARRGRRLLKRR